MKNVIPHLQKQITLVVEDISKFQEKPLDRCCVTLYTHFSEMDVMTKIEAKK